MNSSTESKRSYVEQELKIPFVKQMVENFAEISSKVKCKPKRSEQLSFK